MKPHMPWAASASLTALVLGLAAPAIGAELSVKYRTSKYVYVDAGREQGLAAGDVLLVRSGAETIAELKVEFVAEQSASCTVVNESRPVRSGDTVVRKPQKTQAPAPPPAAEAAAPLAAPAAAPAPPTPAPRPAAPPRGQAWGRVRGGVSLGYYKVVDDTASAYDFEQRTARLDVSVSDIGGRPLSLTGRVRSRQDLRARTLGSMAPKNERDDRIYELALRYAPASDAFSLEAGRIAVSRLGGFGYIDGALAEARVFPGFYAGAFAGERTDPAGIEPGGRGPKYGAFLRMAPGGRWSHPWEMVVGAVREMAASEVSREYLSVESRLNLARSVSFFELAEIDWNGDWRKAASNGRTFQISNLAMALNLRLSPLASASVSYDNRRNYRTHLNRTVAENVFDDLTRQGLRGTLNLGKGQGLGASLGGGVRLQDKQDQRSYSAFGSLRHGGLFGGWLSASLDGSGYTSGFGDGFMASARLGHRFKAGHSVDLSYTDSLYRVGDAHERHKTQWLRFSGRVEMPRRIYFVGDLEYDQGDDMKGPRAFLELGYRF